MRLNTRRGAVGKKLRDGMPQERPSGMETRRRRTSQCWIETRCETSSEVLKLLPLAWLSAFDGSSLACCLVARSQNHGLHLSTTPKKQHCDLLYSLETHNWEKNLKTWYCAIPGIDLETLFAKKSELWQHARRGAHGRCDTSIWRREGLHRM